MGTLCLSLWWYTRWMLPWHEKRQDLVIISDRVLDRFPLADTSIFVNVLEHTAHVYYIYQAFLQGTVPCAPTLLSWIILIWSRSIMLYVCPFRVRPDARFLNDFVQEIVLGDVLPFENDLFFSGHIATNVMMGLTSSVQRSYFFWNALFIAFFMLFSKVHYTVDMLVAPYVAFVSYRMAVYCLEVFQTS